MRSFEGQVVRVTGPAEILQRLRQQLGLVGGMRVVAGGAHAVLHGKMHRALVTELVVAGVTKIWEILCELEGLLAFLRMWCLHRLVAAVAGFGDGMDRRAFQQRRMTLGGNTAVLRHGLTTAHQARARQEHRQQEAASEILLIHAPIPSLHFVMGRTSRVGAAHCTGGHAGSCGGRHDRWRRHVWYRHGGQAWHA